MILCLDTNVIIDIARGSHEGVRSQWNRVGATDRPVVISSLVIHEIETGLVLSGQPDVQRQRYQPVLRQAKIVPFDAADAQVSGEVRARLQKAGTPIGPLDTLIAGQALARGWTVVTRNVRHFGRVEGLSLIDWAVGAEPLTPEVIAGRLDEL